MRGYEFFAEKSAVGWTVWKTAVSPRLYPVDVCLMWYPTRQHAEALVEFLVAQEKELEGVEESDLRDQQS